MREGWKKVKIGNIIEPLTTVNPTKQPDEYFEYIDVSSVSRVSFSIESLSTIKGADAPSRARRLVRNGDVIFATIRPTLQRIAVVPEDLDNAVCSTGFFVLRPKETVFFRFLFHYLFSASFSKNMETLQRGASYPAVSDKDVRAQFIPLPPLPEQKRIVAILDEAFEAIDTAIDNTRKNIQNAQELFDSELNRVFTEKGEGWEEKRLGEAIRLKSGDGLTQKNMIEGPYPVYGGNGISGYHNQFNMEGENVIIGRVGALCGNVRCLNEQFWLTDNAFRVLGFENDFDAKFLTYLLNAKNLGSYARQTAQPVISNSSLSSVVLTYPRSLDLQKRVVEILERLKSQRESLRTCYTQKLSSLSELRQSILQKAFTGELTGGMADEMIEGAGV